MQATDGRIAVDPVAIFNRDQRRRGLREGTLARRGQDVRALDAWMKARDGGILNATRDDIENWLDSKGAIAAKTRATLISSVTAFYACMINEGILLESPAVRVARPKVRPGLPRPIPDDDLREALRFAPPRERCILLLGAYAGLRCQEIAYLQVADLLWSENLIRVTKEMGKGGKERMVPIHPLIAEALKAYGLPKNGYVFHRKGLPYKPARISRIAAEYMESAGFPARMHSLRHWAGTSWCRAGGVRVTKELLGHESLATTAIYTQVTADDMRNVVAAIPNV